MELDLKESLKIKLLPRNYQNNLINWLTIK